jgi:undecaprenyl pyrophosphate synthase
MSYIFFDESGDLGFDFSKQKTSRYFLVTFLFLENNQKRSLEKITKKVFSQLTPNQKKTHCGVFHAIKEKVSTRKKILKMLENKKIKVFSAYLDKKKLFARLNNEEVFIYNLAVNFLLNKIFSQNFLPQDEKIIFVASKRETNKFLNKNFKAYLKQEVEQNHRLNIEIEIKVPSEEKCLQLVDTLSWSLFRAKEHLDDSYKKLFLSKLEEEFALFDT